MTPQQVRLVQESFAQVAPIAGKAADIFYDRLFGIAPELLPLLPEDLSDQKKKLMQMLAAAVAGLHHMATVRPALQNLGRRHARYGVEPAHYERVGAALLWTLEQGLGAAFTPEVKEAWTALYTAVAEMMMQAAANDPLAA